MFRKPGEATSTDESHVTEDEVFKDKRLKSKATRDHRSKLAEDTRALYPTAGRSSASIVAFPNLTQHQRESLFHLSLLELQCKVSAKDMLNKSREANDHLPEDHPEVKSLTALLFAPLAKEWSDKTGLSPDLTGENATGFRDALTTSFKDYLSKAAAKELRELESSSSPKAISANLVGFRVTSQGSPLSPNAGGGSVPSLISGANRSPFKIESVYESEYHEISTLGQGGYGQVFRVRNHLDKQEYAIKKIVITSQRVKRHMEADQVDALLAEVQTLAKLHHMNIVRYFHAWIEYKTHNVQATSTAVPQERLGNFRMLPEPETQETGAGYELTDSLGTGQLKTTSEYGGDHGISQDFRPALDQEIYDDNVVFGYSSAHHSQDPHVESGRVRRASHTTTTSNMTLQTSMLSVAEDDEDPEIENIPRATEDIGVSLSKADLSAMRVMEQPVQSEYFGPDITLFIKMSLHPMTLSRYLSREPIKDGGPTEIRHCFHRDPSVGILSAILDGLDYLHSQRIVHRDIKPANIFLSIHEDKPPALEGCVNIMGCSECSHSDTSKRTYITPCIGDFGLIAEYKEPLKRSDSNPEIPIFESSRLAALQHKPVGTMFYRPISMPKEEPVICPKLDVYSLGVIALELIHKFDTKSERAAVLSNVKQGILPADFEDHVMAAGIKSMVREERDRRWDCGAVRKWLEGMLGKGKGVM
jgi:eukaryotic translation initiation factor 2-alpha kinase 3